VEEARAYARDNERSFFHISRPEIDFPAGTDEHSSEVYAQGLRNLQRFQEKGWLRRDLEPTFYVYRQVMGTHVQAGLVAGASIDEYDLGLIKKHELTRPDKEDDRTRHIEALDGNDEPVFLTYRAQPEIDALVAELMRGDPEYDFATEDRIQHTFWIVGGETNARVAEEFGRVPELYLADGHHRSAAASRVRSRLRELGRKHGRQEQFLAVIFPHNQMQILSYNRVVRDLHGMSTQDFLAALTRSFEVERAGEGKPSRPQEFGMFLDGQWYRLRARPGSFEQSLRGSLDLSILQTNVLEPLLGVGDPRTDKRINFVGGIRGATELERQVTSREYQVAFFVYPTSLEQLMAIADAGEVLPPKSTWFEPKLRSGLVLHLFH
jgi:uncharacterized protein (DUF1015 family)